MEELILRPIQEEMVNQVRNAFRKSKRVILKAATSAGKTAIAAKIFQNAVSRGKRCLFIADRIVLVLQTSDEFNRWGLRHGIIMGDHPEYYPDRQVQVASAATLLNRRVDQFDIILQDECFDGDTLISTPGGFKKISLVKKGDVVYNACEFGVVYGVSKSFKQTLRMRLSNGKEIRCTGDHPFFTVSGWKKAKELGRGERLFSKEDVSDLWTRVPSENGNTFRWFKKNSGRRSDMEQEHNMLKVLHNEMEEPLAQQRYCSEKCEKESGKQNEQNKKQGWEWSCYGITAKAMRCAWSWLGNGSYSKNEDNRNKRDTNSKALQNRCGQQRENDSHRSGREITSFFRQARSRCQKNKSFDSIRVESIEIDKPGIGCDVYNLKVSRHPSYYAGGVLVHNCHTICKGAIKAFDANPNAYILGLTASPYSKGLGKIFDFYIEPFSVKHLIQKGLLCGYDVYGPAPIDLTGVRTTAGEYNQDDLAVAVDKPGLTADIIQSYLKFAKGKKAICFSTNVAHGRALEKEFNRHGISAKEINAYQPKEGPESAKEIIEEFRNNKFKVLISVSIIIKGFSVSDVECVSLAMATKSIIKLTQCLGRGLRLHSGKEKCIVLDHGTNFERLGWPDDFQFDELDDGKHAESKNKKQDRPEKLPKLCVSCNFLKPAGFQTCPACKFTPKFIQDVEVSEGTLQKLQRKAKSEFTLQEKQSFLAQLNQYCQDKGYKTGGHGCFGYAIRTFKDRFGVIPSNKISWSKREPVSIETRKYIQHINIKNNYKRKQNEVIQQPKAPVAGLEKEGK